MLIYLDLCCFNRPFDDQSQLMVRLQTEAKLHVQTMIQDGVLKLAWSAIIDLENAANPDLERRKAVAQWQPYAYIDIATTEQVEKIAEVLSAKGIKAMDALHIASAIAAHTAYFLTTDKLILRKMAGNDQIHVVDPIDFVRKLTGEQDEN